MSMKNDAIIILGAILFGMAIGATLFGLATASYLDEQFRLINILREHYHG